MRHFFDWFSRHVRPEEPWLILGKGPSFGARDRYDLSRYRLLSLNHTVREQPVFVAHMIDLDVVRACQDILERQADVVAMPWYPHVRNAVGTLSLAELVPTVPVLARLAFAGRLLWYDLSTAPTRYGPGPVVRATYFSSEAVLSLLALAGVRRVRSLGVDGGAAYSTDFQDLVHRTLLANGHATFDLQFQGIARTILETGVDFAPLDVPYPFRVCVAYAPREALAASVLEHSIRRRTSLHVEVIRVPVGSAPRQEGPTLVLSPRLQCLADLRRLWTDAPSGGEGVIPVQKGGAARDDTLPVALAIIGATAADLGELASAVRARCSVRDLARMGVRLRPGLHPGWQPADRYTPGRTSFVYFADDGSEPWLTRAHPLGHVWVRDLIDGIACGTILLSQVEEEVRLGHVRPSLLHQARYAAEEPMLLPRRARDLDRGFQAPEGWQVCTTKPAAYTSMLVGAIARTTYRQARAYWTTRRSRQVAVPKS